jgi:hypothetical protein
VLQLYANLYLQIMAPVKLPIGYKCRLFDLSRNLLGLRDYSIDPDKGCNTESTPLRILVECENNAAAGEPSVVHVTAPFAFQRQRWIYPSASNLH